MIIRNTLLLIPDLSLFINADLSGIWMFLGRFHPVIVHLPIGFLFAVVTLEYLAARKNLEHLRHATTFILGMTAISSVIAALLGYFLSLEGGYDEDILTWHKWFGIALAAGSCIAWLFRYKLEQSASRNFRLGYISFLIISFLLLIGTGHQGGSLTHGSDYLTSAMPEPLRALAGLPEKKSAAPIKITNIKEAMVYQHIIQPILNQRCTNCHGTSKKKGDLMLNDMENMLKGGENGKVITLKKPFESKLYTHLLLPEIDDRHMPPKGKPQLSKEQIRIIGWWIEQGAPVNKKVAELNTPDSISIALAKIADGEKKPEGVFARKVKPADPKVIIKLKEHGIRLKYIAEQVNYLQASLDANIDTFGIEQARSMLEIAPQLAWLDLSSKKIHPEAVNLLSKFSNLSRLRLENSDVKDDMLKNISSLKNLEYLNLYGTGITDSAIKYFIPLKKLRFIYLWQTKVTPAEANRLRTGRNASLVINMGNGIEKDSLLTSIN